MSASHWHRKPLESGWSISKYDTVNDPYKIFYTFGYLRYRLAITHPTHPLPTSLTPIGHVMAIGPPTQSLEKSVTNHGLLYVMRRIDSYVVVDRKAKTIFIQHFDSIDLLTAGYSWSVRSQYVLFRSISVG